MGKVFSTQLEIYMEGLDEPLLVVADQRDFAAWEAHSDGSTGSITMQRYLAWHAGTRTGKVSVAWEVFNEKLCIQAVDPTAEDEQGDEQEDEQGLDPGRPRASAS